MEATIKVAKYFGNIDGDDVIALYIRTKATKADIDELIDNIVHITPFNIKSEGMSEEMRATPKQMQEAAQLIQSGKTPLEVVSITGVSLATAYKLSKESKASNNATDNSLKEKEITKPVPRVPVNSEVTSKMMSEKDLGTYGKPSNIQFTKIPKEMQIEIGPVGISLTEEVVKAVIEPLKSLGFEDIRLTVVAVAKGDENHG